MCKELITVQCELSQVEPRASSTGHGACGTCQHGETEMIIAAPIEQMIPEIVKKNGVEGVDSVGGATLSSEGIKAAVKDALSKAQ